MPRPAGKFARSRDPRAAAWGGPGGQGRRSRPPPECEEPAGWVERTMPAYNVAERLGYGWTAAGIFGGQYGGCLMRSREVAYVLLLRDPLCWGWGMCVACLPATTPLGLRWRNSVVCYYTDGVARVGYLAIWHPFALDSGSTPTRLRLRNDLYCVCVWAFTIGIRCVEDFG